MGRKLTNAWWHEKSHLNETQPRIDATIAQAVACHMSNAKWRKLFAVLRDVGVREVRWKFVRDDHVATALVPAEHNILEACLADVMPAPHVAFREIDWIEIQTESSDRVTAALNAAGKFPIQQLETGIRIVGYSWE